MQYPEWLTKVVGGIEGESTKIAWWRLWRLVLISSWQQDQSRLLPERRKSLYTNDRAIMSGPNNISVILSLDGYDTTLPVDFRDLVRSRLADGVRASFVSYSLPTTIEWASPEMKSRMKNYARMDAEVGDVSAYNYQENLTALSRNDWLRQSIKYLANADIKRGVQMFGYYSHIIISGTRGEEFDESLQKVIALCTKFGLTTNRVSRHLGTWERALSPMAQGLDSKVLKTVAKNVFPDEVISRFVAYDQGRIGHSGIYLGTDITSGDAILKRFKKDDVDAENILVLAETGWGKSFFVKSQLLQLLANRRVKGTIMDIEGTEYLPMANFLANNDDVVVLNMAEGQGSYFDPVAIVCSGSEEIDKENNCFGLSRSYTLALFRSLIGEDALSSNQWAEVVLKDAVAKTYADAGVVSSVYETWSRSSHLTLRDVYNNLTAYRQSPRYQNKEYQDAVDLVMALTGQYFESPENGGLLSDTFSNRVSLTDVASAKLVVCSFGMASRAGSTVDPKQMALTQLSAANISHIRSLFCKAEGKFNLKVWEELQRWAAFPGSEEILNVAITGGRKMGDINFVVSNDPRMFLGAGAKLGIFSNITSFMVGAISDAVVREEIATSLSVPELLPDLTSLVEQAGDVETFNEDSSPENESPYRRAFLMKLDKSVVTLGKVLLPAGVAQSMLFRTGSIETQQNTPTSTFTEDTSSDWVWTDTSSVVSKETETNPYASGWLTPEEPELDLWGSSDEDDADEVNGFSDDDWK